MKGVVIVMIFASIIHAASFSNSFVQEKIQEDSDYKTALEYFYGDKGAKVIKKVLNSCPYERCKHPTSSNVIRHEDRGGKKIYYIKVPDYKKALEYLQKSLMRGNLQAAEFLYNILSQEVNYRSPKPNRYLIQKMEQKYGISYEKYLSLLKFALRLLATHGKYIEAYRYFDPNFGKKR